MPDKKKLFINASTAKYSGGLIVSIDFIIHLLELDTYQLVLCAPDIKSYKQFSNRLQYIKAPELLFKYPLRWILDYIWLPIQIRKACAEVVFSLTNLPAITRKRQYMLHDNPYLTHDFSTLHLNSRERWTHQIRNLFFRMRVNYVDAYWVQTGFEKKLLQQILPADKEIKVLPPFVPAHLLNSKPSFFKDGAKAKVLKILCPGRYYPHKNLDYILTLATKASELKIAVTFQLTLDIQRTDIPTRIRKAVRQPNFPIENLGSIAPDDFPTYIETSDAILVPSFFETFGLCCIDAWYFQKPLFISDKPFARHICEDAATYLSLHEPEADLRILMDTLHSNEKCSVLVEAGQKKHHQLCSNERFSMFLHELMESE